MKKRFRIMVSLIILTVAGAGLFFWAYHPPERQRESWQAEILEFSEENPTPEEKSGDGLEEKQKEEQSADEGDREKQSAEAEDKGQPSEEGNYQPEGESRESVLVFAGDIYLSPYVLDRYNGGGIQEVLSENLLSEMINADITMANEEFPFSVGGEQAPDKQFTFRVEPSYVKILKEMGIDVVSLANNHALDYGKDALADTFAALDEAGIAYVGAGQDKERAAQPFFAQAGQKTFGFLGASRVIPVPEWNIENRQPGMLCTYDSGALCEAVRRAKEQCDFLTVYVHWGIEREHTPEEYQRQLAKAYIDAGADLVVGAHPHVLQGIEYYNGRPIVYSLGNYIFNQEIADTVLLKVTVSQENQTKLQLIPAYAAGAKTQEKSGEQVSELYRFLEEISYEIQIGEDGTVH